MREVIRNPEGVARGITYSLVPRPHPSRGEEGLVTLDGFSWLCIKADWHVKYHSKVTCKYSSANKSRTDSPKNITVVSVQRDLGFLQELANMHLRLSGPQATRRQQFGKTD